MNFLLLYWKKIALLVTLLIYNLGIPITAIDTQPRNLLCIKKSTSLYNSNSCYLKNKNKTSLHSSNLLWLFVCMPVWEAVRVYCTEMNANYVLKDKLCRKDVGKQWSRKQKLISTSGLISALTMFLRWVHINIKHRLELCVTKTLQ